MSSDPAPFEEKENQVDIDGVLCLLCSNSLSSPDHGPISCLPCGHMYGSSCIDNWLRDSSQQECVRCKSKGKMEDVRRLHITKVVTVNGNLLKEVETLEAKCSVLQRMIRMNDQDLAQWRGWEEQIKKQPQDMEKIDAQQKQIEEQEERIRKQKEKIKSLEWGLSYALEYLKSTNH